MELNKYRIELNSKEDFITRFRENLLRRDQYILEFSDGIVLKGVPVSNYNDGNLFRISCDGGEIYNNLPISLIDKITLVAKQDDTFYMAVAIEESRKCIQDPDVKEPKPLVGAVLVKDESIIHKGFRGQFKPGDHAEYSLLEKGLKDRSVSGAVLYTTLEPCTKRGPDKQPCVERIVARRIYRVVIGMLDPNQLIRGEGVWKLREAGVEVGLCASNQMSQIEEINREFIQYHRRQ